MRNIEKYKDNIEKHIDVCGLYQDIYKIKNGKYAHDCCNNCDKCYDSCIRWLAEEFKEPVLDEVEREYLSAVIKPFRNKIATISKLHTYDNINYENNEYIFFGMKDRRGYSLPLFKQGTMYKGMQQGKHYTLQELGL